MATLTVITLTLNEEHNLSPCLDSARWADELIVVDSGSHDRTVEIARTFTERVFTISWEGYGAARNYALRQATGDWILWLDADERVTPALAEEIRSIIRADVRGVDGYAIARRAYFLGRWIRHSGWYPGRVVRLFRRGTARFSETQVHEQLQIDGVVVPTEHDLLHFTDPDLHHYLAEIQPLYLACCRRFGCCREEIHNARPSAAPTVSVREDVSVAGRMAGRHGGVHSGRALLGVCVYEIRQTLGALPEECGAGKFTLNVYEAKVQRRMRWTLPRSTSCCLPS